MFYHTHARTHPRATRALTRHARTHLSLDRKRLQEVLPEVRIVHTQHTHTARHSARSPYLRTHSASTQHTIFAHAYVTHRVLRTRTRTNLRSQVVLENLEALQRIEDDDTLVAELLKKLRAKNVKLRSLSVHTNKMV